MCVPRAHDPDDSYEHVSTYLLSVRTLSQSSLYAPNTRLTTSCLSISLPRILMRAYARYIRFNISSHESAFLRMRSSLAAKARARSFRKCCRSIVTRYKISFPPIIPYIDIHCIKNRSCRRNIKECQREPCIL